MLHPNFDFDAAVNVEQANLYTSFYATEDSLTRYIRTHGGRNEQNGSRRSEELGCQLPPQNERDIRGREPFGFHSGPSGSNVRKGQGHRCFSMHSEVQQPQDTIGEKEEGSGNLFSDSPPLSPSDFSEYADKRRRTLSWDGSLPYKETKIREGARYEHEIDNYSAERTYIDRRLGELATELYLAEEYILPDVEEPNIERWGGF